VPRVVKPKHARQLELLRAWSRLLDNRFRVPGTDMRFGLDPIVGLFPLLGDIATPLFGLVIVVHAFRMGIPAIVQARMLANILIDSAVGAVPVVGDLFDFAWKSNTMNLALLELHAYEVVRPSTADWLVVSGVVAVLVTLVAVPLIALVWIVHALESLRLL
jgi:Domain of unknown function (DUF4112)